MTTSNIDVKNMHIAAIQAIIDDSEAFERVLNDEKLCDEIYERPYLVELWENAVTVYDDAKFIETEQEESETKTDGFLAAFTSQPKTENFGQRMAKARKAKKPAKRKTKKAEPVSYEYRVKHYKSGTAGNIVRGKEKRPSANTVAFERLNDKGEVVERVMMGTTQAKVVADAVRAADNK